MPQKFNRGLDEPMLEGGVGGMGGAGGRYKASGKKSFDATQDAANTLSTVFGVPLAAAAIAELSTKKNADPEDMRKSLQYEKNKREAEAEMKRETRGMAKGGKVFSASKRADGIAQRGKTRGKLV